MNDLGPILTRFATLLNGHGEPDGTLAHSQPATPLGGGLINDTYALGDHHILQRLHPIFGPGVNDDIAALTRHLHRAGVPVPHLCPAADGATCAIIEHDDERLSGVWRILTRLPGTTLHRLADEQQARSAGALVARFHRGLADVDHTFAFTRPGAHDTDKHMASVDDALTKSPEHRLFRDVHTLRHELRERWRSWRGPGPLPVRIGHGDLKVSNLLFDDGGAAIGVLDLDTMAHMTLDIELGDALRSWCNRAAEDSERANFDVDLFRGAITGYVDAMGDTLTTDEARAVVPGLLRICLELSARFAADAINERYFGWNPAIGATRGEHNLLRARGQLDLARQVSEQRKNLTAIVEQVRA